MVEEDNFFTFNDLSPEARILWASPSIYTCLGYDPNEVVGITPYSWIHPDDIPACKVVHQENVLNEIVGTQMSFRMRRKNGTYASCVIIGCVCYQYIVTCHTVKADGSIRKFAVHGVHSTAMANLVGSRKKEFERIRHNHKAFGPSTWNPANLILELRGCLLINRFTRNLSIIYASSSCELILNLDSDDLLGKPLLCFIRADELSTFVEQSDIARSTPSVRHLRFWFQSPNCLQEVPCEAMLFGASDALILILRKCLPYRRRQLITDYSPLDISSNLSNSTRRHYKHGNHGHHSNPHTVESASPSSTYSNSRVSYISSSVSSCMVSPSSSPSLALSSSPSYSTSAFINNLQSTQTYRTPLRSMSMGSINNIRGTNNEQNRQRPLMALCDDICEDPETMLQLRELHAEDVDVEESELEEGVRELDIHAEFVRHAGEKEEEGVYVKDHYGGEIYNDNMGSMIIDEEIEEVEMPPSRRRQRRERNS